MSHLGHTCRVHGYLIYKQQNNRSNVFQVLPWLFHSRTSPLLLLLRVTNMFIKFIITLLYSSREGLSKGHRCTVVTTSLQQGALPTAAAGKPETQTIRLSLGLFQGRDSALCVFGNSLWPAVLAQSVTRHLVATQFRLVFGLLCLQLLYWGDFVL